MSALDRLQGYSSRKKPVDSSSVFDTSTPEGAFLNVVHRNGYSMYKHVYRLKSEFLSDDTEVLEYSKEQYDILSPDEQAKFEEAVVYSELHDVLTTPGNQVVNAVAGSGKALPIHTKVVTPTGMQPIGDVKVGDMVAGEDGKFHRVLGVFPQGRKRMYIVRFHNGIEIPCSPDHLWTVRVGSKIITETAEWLRGLVDCHDIYVETCEPVDFIDKNYLGIDPYVLGRYINSGKDHLDTVAEDWFVRYDFGDICAVRAEELLWELMKDKEKTQHIVCRLPIADRRRLLFGLLDQRSKFNGEYHCFVAGEEFVCDIVTEVAESLGLVVSHTKFWDNFYQIRIYTKLTREQLGDDRISLATDKLKIIEVVDTQTDVEMVCIQIDSPKHLYLTEHYVPTHNTTALVFKILHDIVTGEATTYKEIPNGNRVRVVNKMWVCTFLKSGAEELEKALQNWQTKLGYTRTGSQISFSTMDAEFYRCLKAMGVEVKIGETRALFKKAIDMCHITRKGYNLSLEDYRILEGIFVYCRGRLDSKRYQHPNAEEYSLTPTVIDMVLHYFSVLKTQAGIMDFEDVMELLYKYLYTEPNPAVQDFVANRYNFIYVDEFQDTSQMAYAILKFYGRGHLWMNCNGGTEGEPGLFTGRETVGKFVVVGDPSQCLAGGSLVTMADGSEKIIRDIRTGDFVQTALGRGKIGTARVIATDNHVVDSYIRITTDMGHIIECSTTHEIPIKRSFCLLEGNPVAGYSVGKVGWPTEYPGYIRETSFAYLDAEANGYASCSTYLENETLIRAVNITVNDWVLVADKNGLHYEAVIDIEKVDGSLRVYDITVQGAHNFIANGVLVHNCIYSFRGSDSKILTENVDNDFRPTLSRLSVNWRCPDKILDPIVPSIHRNEDSASQDIVAANEGGELSVLVFKSIQQMLDRLCVDLGADMQENLSSAVLCRTNFDGLLPAFILEDSGKFNFSISGENMTMDSPLPRKLLGAAALFTEKSGKRVRQVLEILCGRNKWEAAGLADAIKNSNKSLWDIPEVDLKYSAPNMADILLEIKKIIAPDGVRNRENDIAGLMYLYNYMMTDVYGGDSAFCESARSYINVLMYMISTHNFSSVYDFVDEVNFINDKLHSRVKKANTPIQIATVHEFKGKERDSIIIWNDTENVFPSSKCDVTDEELLAEERRVHYIACTRARKRERIYTRAGQMGYFLKEMSVSPEFVPLGGVTLNKEA